VSTRHTRSGFRFTVPLLGIAAASVLGLGIAGASVPGLGIAGASVPGLGVAAASVPGLRFAAASTARPVLDGAWQARRYHLASGESHPVRGRIFFTRNEWQVLFFVMDGEEPRRGSGEGGRYTLDGDDLTFEHLFHLSAGDEMEGLPASPLTLTARAGEGTFEPTQAIVAGDELTLRFPSGNSMIFVRSSPP